MSRFGKALALALILVVAFSAGAFAAIPDGVVLLGDKAYSLDYANNPANFDEIMAAFLAGGGAVYIKDFGGNWRDNTAPDVILDPAVVGTFPAVTYKDSVGAETVYAPGDTGIALTVTAVAASKTYGAADPALTYTVTSGALQAGDSFSGSLTRENGDNVGTYQIQQGTLTAGDKYTITYVAADLTVNKAPLTITAQDKSKVYGQADPDLTVVYDGFVLGDDEDVVAGLAIERAAGEDVDTYAITPSGATAANYDITLDSGVMTITAKPLTVTAGAKSKTYGDADPALTYTSVGLVGADAISGSLTRAAGSNVGAYAITQGTLTAGDNYTITYNGANLTINPRPLTITAEAKGKTYGDADPALTYEVVGMDNGDPIDGALARAAGENVGAYAITQGTLTAGSNYSITYNSADLTISAKALTVTADAQNKTYGAADPALTYTSVGLVGDDEIAGTLTRAAGENVGAYAITVGTLDAGGNYSTTYNGANLTIGKAPLTITAEDKSKVYGGGDPALTVTYSGFVLGDGAGVISNLEVTRAAGANVGTYTITPAGATAANYNISFVTGTLTITAKPITVTADAKNKVYGNADPALSYQITAGALEGGDSFIGALGRVSGESVGDYVILQGTLTAGTNYSITYVSDNLTITPKALTLAGLTAANRVYNGLDAAAVTDYGTLTGKVGDDVVTLDTTGASASFANKTVANSKTVTVTGLALGGAAAGNYSIADQTTTADITAKPLTLAGLTAANKPYDGNDEATVSNYGTLTGKVGEDDVSLVTAGASASFATVTADEGKTVTVTGLALGGADAGNYSIADQAATADITPKPLTLPDLAADDKVYNAATGATIDVYGDLDGVVGGDDVTLDTAGASASFASKTVGAGKTVTVTGLALGGTAAGNYSIANQTTTAAITAKTLTIGGSFTAQNKVYDRSSAVTFGDNSLTLPGVVGGDAVTLSAVARFATINVADGIAVNLSIECALLGDDKDNYSLSLDGAPSTTADITKKEVTVGGTFTANDKVYDTFTSATIDDNNLTLVGVIVPDTVSLAAVAVFADADVGAGKTVSLTGSTLAGAISGNYELSLVGAPTTTASILPGSAQTFDVEVPAGPFNAGTPFNITSITARDQWGHVATSYTGVKTLSYGDPSNSPDGTEPVFTTEVTFTAGVAENIATTLYCAESPTITVADGAVTGTSAAVTVNPLTATEFEVTPAAGGVDAGDLLAVTVAAVDQYGNTATSYAGDKWIEFSGALASPSGDDPQAKDKTGAWLDFGFATKLEFADGVAVTEVTLYKAEDVDLQAEDINVGLVGVSETITVAPLEINSLAAAIAGGNQSISAGQTVTVNLTAKDVYENPIADDTLINVVFSGLADAPDDTEPTATDWEDDPVVFGDSTTLNFVGGAASSTVTAYMVEADRAITATKDAISGTTVQTVSVTQGDQWWFTADWPGHQTAGTPFTIGVDELQDSWGNLLTGDYTVRLRNNHLAEDAYNNTVAFVAGEGTTGNITLTFAHPHVSQTYNYTLTVTGAAGQSIGFAWAVNPAGPDSVTVADIVGDKTAGASFDVVMSELEDEYGNTLLDGNYTVVIESDVDLGRWDGAVAFAGGAATKAIFLETAGAHELTIKVNGVTVATAVPVTVVAGVPDEVTFANIAVAQTAGVEFNIAASVSDLKDAYGNTVADGDYTVSVTSSADGLVFGPTDVTFTAGAPAAINITLETAAGHTLTLSVNDAAAVDTATVTVNPAGVNAGKSSASATDQADGSTDVTFLLADAYENDITGRNLGDLRDEVEIRFNATYAGIPQGVWMSLNQWNELASVTVGAVTEPVAGTYTFNWEGLLANMLMEVRVDGVVIQTGASFVITATLDWVGDEFVEVLANDGSTTDDITLTLTGDTFVVSGGALVLDTHYTVSANLPAGLTVAINTGGGADTATITLTGNAAAHAAGESVTTLRITFLNAAFTKGNAAQVTEYQQTDLKVTFADGPAAGDPPITAVRALPPAYAALDTITIKFSEAVDITKITMVNLVLGVGNWDDSGIVADDNVGGYATTFTITLSNGGGLLSVTAADTITIAKANVVNEDGYQAEANVVFTLP